MGDIPRLYQIACLAASSIPHYFVSLYTMSFPTDLPPVTLLLQEIQAITSSMKRNQRWATTSTSSFTSAITPLPPSLNAARASRRGTNSKIASPRRGRSSIDGEEGDLMTGFVQLRRSLANVKGDQY